MATVVSKETIERVRLTISEHPDLSRKGLAEELGCSRSTIDAAIKVGKLDYTANPRGGSKSRKTRKGKKTASIEEVISLSRDANMTYGQYVQLHPDI